MEDAAVMPPTVDSMAELGRESPPREHAAVLSIVGPDGAGKTTLIDALLRDQLAGAPVMRIRRPGILYRRTVPDVPVTEPHRDPPYPPLLSLAKTAYLFVDVLLGWNLRIRPFVRRGGWVIIERGWWDIAVDPRRYRMRPHGRLLWLLGRILPAPDLLMILEAPPEVVFARKTELSIDELARQMKAWRRHLPRSQRHVFLDASRPADEVVAGAGAEVERFAGDLASASARPGWTGVPTRAEARWVLPRGLRGVALSGLYVYHPVTDRARLGWRGARLAAGLGGFRLLRRGAAPPEPVRRALAGLGGPGHTVAVARANHPGRYLAALIGPEGDCRGMAKIATDGAGRAALKREAEALEELGSLLAHPLSPPQVIASDDGLLVFEMEQWRPRPRPWRLPSSVAEAAGAFFAAGGEEGLAHGDFAPWNLLHTLRGWVVVDWESARRSAPPFYDVWHYLIQGHVLLGRPRSPELFGGMRGEGWVGDALRAYASGAGLPWTDARRRLPLYLEQSQAYLDASKPDGAAGVKARKDLLAELGG